MPANPQDLRSTCTAWRLPELHIEEPGHPPRRILLRPGQSSVLGRGRSCDLPLDDPRVSRNHLRIDCTPEGLVALDLGSRTGTCLNGRRLTARGRVALHDGDVLRLGRTRITVRHYSERLARFIAEEALPEQSLAPPPPTPGTPPTPTVPPAPVAAPTPIAPPAPPVADSAAPRVDHDACEDAPVPPASRGQSDPKPRRFQPARITALAVAGLGACLRDRLCLAAGLLVLAALVLILAAD